MADLMAISQAFASLKAAKDIATAAVDLRDSTAFLVEVGKLNEKIVDAQNSIFAIQQDRSALVETVCDLKKRVSELEAWNAEKQRYELYEVAPGRLCYRIKESMRATEPPHYICANCYAAGQKRFLQQTHNGPGYFRFHCHACGLEITYSPPSRETRGNYMRDDF